MTGLISNKHSWGKRIQVCSNEGSRPVPSGDCIEIEKMENKYFINDQPFNSQKGDEDFFS